MRGEAGVGIVMGEKQKGRRKGCGRCKKKGKEGKEGTASRNERIVEATERMSRRKV